MKKLILLATATVLAGCSQAAEKEPMAEATETTAAEPAMVMAADGEPAPGMYRITTGEGEVFTEEVKPDGTYVQTDAEGNVIETGQWEQKSPEQYCTIVDEQYREQGDAGEQKCNTEGIGEDGVWTSTNAEGQTATVERVEG
ncbi:hypothetical protein [Qipengyuania qiaonensis]|uniref:Lipoprotein n=1 Tax=Qipengyuania qiaonensis TaxID=2867240 RepID=A0ABS7J506_9SPHN|nr:hypothetical protein [Qipengyuania qiaonensis]MBX7482426.1 hypothetical protein [Qipengyuania qiaonensis]